jgi:ubiquinone/menaquinone biosynthesis C-methylase UbiE
MQRNVLLALVGFLCLSFWQPSRYSTQGAGKPDPNGVNKYYMGRQIAMVMGHFGIEWLERPEREAEEQVTTLLQNMALKPGEMVADIGAGSGYHVMRMAPMVEPNGLVYGVDIQPEMVAYLQNQAKAANRKNVRPLLSTAQSVKLAPASIDKMLLVDVYHEFYYPYEMAVSMLEALKPGGRLYLVEYRAEDPTVPIKPIHKMTEKQAVAELAAAGFRFVKNINNLPWQHCMVFEKPKG